jgi:preprotein translocase subunit YajC
LISRKKISNVLLLQTLCGIIGRKVLLPIEIVVFSKRGEGMSTGMIQISGLILIFVIMYMLMIRPQKKKERAVNEMRSSLKAGDEVVTIGGIKGKVVSVKDSYVTIAVGADKAKFDIMKWGISKVEGAPTPAQKKTAKEEAAKEEEKPAKKPKKLGAAKEEAPAAEAATEAAAEAPAPVEADAEVEVSDDEKADE